MVASVLMSATKLTKRFGTNIVLDGIDFTLQRELFHVLMGENGAGKSTFIKMIGGLLQPDGGEIRIRGNIVDLRQSGRRSRARRARCPSGNSSRTDAKRCRKHFSEAMPRRSFGRIDRRKMRPGRRKRCYRASECGWTLMRRLKLWVSRSDNLWRSRRALARKAEILILDEPTAALSAAEVEALLERLRLLKAQGLGLIYISHRMEEVRRIGDVVSVLRDGGWPFRSRSLLSPMTR